MSLSIRRRLLARLISAIIVCWLIAIAFVYFAAYREVNEIYDAALAQQSRVLATLMTHESEEELEVRKTLKQLIVEVGPDLISRSPLFRELIRERLGPGAVQDYLTLIDRESIPGHRYESKIAFIVIDEEDTVLLRSNMPVTFDEFTSGFSERTMEGKLWRTYGLKEPRSKLRVQVGEQFSIRQEMVVDIVYNSVWPLLMAMPLFALVIWVTVGGGLKPLQRVTVKVERRDSNSLVPISPDGVPVEVVPMVKALNRLFSRVQKALDTERRFTADAAHELRTPLAALKAIAQAKQLGSRNHEHDEFLQQVINGVDRTSHLLEQLLTLARMESQSMALGQLQSVDLPTQLLEVLSEIGQLALDRQIDLAYDGKESGVIVKGYAPALQIMIRNLIDNAIRYTPDGGSVRIAIESHERDIRLLIEDTGPGIPLEQVCQVFQRFKRGESELEEGSGLGLSIVHRIIELHHGRIELENRVSDRGLRVSVYLASAA
jgi:two-component system sensor histidine kinase QseC